MLSKVAATMEAKIGKQKKEKKKGWCAEFVQILGYRVTISFNQRRFYVSHPKTVSVILCDDTQTPFCHSKTNGKKPKQNTLLFRQNKLHSLHSTARWHRAPVTALSFMRQLPPPPTQVFSKSDCWMLTSSQNRRLSPLGFQFCHSFPSPSIEKCRNLGNRDKKQTNKMKHQARDDFICLCRYFNEFNQRPVWLDGTQAVIESALLLCGI